MDINPEKAKQLIKEMEAQWEAMKNHPVAGPFITSFSIPPADEWDWESPNGVTHHVIEGRCVTCGRSHKRGDDGSDR